ncbi:hypothetical protein TIFTF001_034527 [Ficus carica]|uniref:Uncharacterized protein n=1 Tax=Ficus carica TaxID=3494 RepID=A0AA88E0K5_FICCA|nr:hypothetical protein TIFTF001_034527 [Ficus carica]
MQDASQRQHATSEKSRMPDQEKMQDASPRQDATSEKQIPVSALSVSVLSSSTPSCFKELILF